MAKDNADEDDGDAEDYDDDDGDKEDEDDDEVLLVSCYIAQFTKWLHRCVSWQS